MHNANYIYTQELSQNIFSKDKFLTNISFEQPGKYCPFAFELFGIKSAIYTFLGCTFSSFKLFELKLIQKQENK